jgi:hypothetical protein
VFVCDFACWVPSGCKVDHHEGVLVDFQVFVQNL